jgi:hypothetical protein
MLRECVAEAKTENDPIAYERLKELAEFVETMGAWYSHVRKLPASGWRKMAKMGGMIGKLVRG